MRSILMSSAALGITILVMALPHQAMADDCLLDTNNSGNATDGVDTDNGVFGSRKTLTGIQCRGHVTDDQAMPLRDVLYLRGGLPELLLFDDLR